MTPHRPGLLASMALRRMIERRRAELEAEREDRYRFTDTAWEWACLVRAELFRSSSGPALVHFADLADALARCCEQVRGSAEYAACQCCDRILPHGPPCRACGCKGRTVIVRNWSGEK